MFQLYLDWITIVIYVFTIGLFGLLFCNRHLILILICFELILLSLATLFIFGAILSNTLLGQIVPLILLCLAGADSAFGLALFILTFKQHGTINISRLEQLRH